MKHLRYPEEERRPGQTMTGQGRRWQARAHTKSQLKPAVEVLLLLPSVDVSLPLQI